MLVQKSLSENNSDKENEPDTDDQDDEEDTKDVGAASVQELDGTRADEYDRLHKFEMDRH